MDARERLQAYLEQRREMGESEFVLDGMTVTEALNMMDKLRPAPSRSKQSSEPRPEPRTPRPSRPEEASTPPAAPPDAPPAVAPNASRAQAASVTPRTRAVHGAPDRVAEEPPDAHVDSVPRFPEIGVEDEELAKRFEQGLVVGNSNGTLFEQNPFHSVQSLGALSKLIEDCTRCKLYATAKCAVPGDGDPDADFMCVGEAPGANEDETGRPFVGQAGALLTKILAAIDLTREQVFITNVLKHRPPANRNPQPDEIEACSPYLIRQIQLVKPKVILALGTFAAQTLLNTKTPMGKLRGAVHRYYGIPLIVTYHPAALLRNPAWKRPTWEDVKLARLVLDSQKS